MKRKNLQKHVAGTYLTLRIGLAVLAIAFPIVLTIGGYIRANLPVQHSLSAYYYSGGGKMRDAYVGMIFAVSRFLYLYKGFTWFENYALNLAGIFLVGVALVPEKWDCGSDCGSTLHGTLAVLFFLTIAYVFIFRASDTVNLIPNIAARKRYRKTYKLPGLGTIVAPAIGVLLNSIFGPDSTYSRAVFFDESLGILMFAVYWIVKSRELAQTNAEQAAINGELITRSYRTVDVFKGIPIGPTAGKSLGNSLEGLRRKQPLENRMVLKVKALALNFLSLREGRGEGYQEEGPGIQGDESFSPIVPRDPAVCSPRPYESVNCPRHGRMEFLVDDALQEET